MAYGVFPKIIWRRGYSKKFVGAEISRSCGGEESKYYKLSRCNHSAKEFKHDTRIANLEGRKLVTAAYHDPPRIFMDIDKTVNQVSTEYSTDSESKQTWKVGSTGANCHTFCSKIFVFFIFNS